MGEGGNLAFTQRGRIQFARRGGRINTDAIDNSAGVDTSDHEVNLKILLGLALANGEITPAERDELLAAMADEVAADVLNDVYQQTGAISQELVSSAATMDAYEALMQDLERRRRRALPARGRRHHRARTRCRDPARHRRDGTPARQAPAY